MGDDQDSQERQANRGARERLAWVVVLSAIVLLTILAAVVVWASTSNAMQVFNIVVPVFATWVGTVLAFYFGKENFESASEQARKTNSQVISMAQLSTEQRAAQPVTATMLKVADITTFPLAGPEDGISMQQVLDWFTTNEVTRMPIVDPVGKPKYMIHQADVVKYMIGRPVDPVLHLSDFLNEQKKLDSPVLYDLGHAFAIVKESATLADAKAAMEALPRGKDVFVAVNGTADEPLIGWISDAMLQRSLKA